ncbi:MAG: helix-turn-helix domain-containing protein [Cytophagaceae bacterium]
MNSLILNIRTIRKQKGISQESLAYDLGIDYSTYGKIERGVISLTIDRLEKIAQILGVSVADIYGWSKSEEGFNQNSIEIIQRLKDELEQARKEIELLKQQLSDKEKIIFLLENKLNKNGVS